MKTAKVRQGNLRGREYSGVFVAQGSGVVNAEGNAVIGWSNEVVMMQDF